MLHAATIVAVSLINETTYIICGKQSSDKDGKYVDVRKETATVIERLRITGSETENVMHLSLFS